MLLENECINVCYCINDRTGNYARIMGTSLFSLLVNTEEKLKIHILHDDTLTAGNKARLEKMVKDRSSEIYFYNMDIIMAEKIGAIDEKLPSLRNLNISIASMYRLMLGEVFEDKIEKIIYLDCDTVVNMDIKYLWEESVSVTGLATVSDQVIQLHRQRDIFKNNTVKVDEYFNSGVLLIDIKKYAEKAVLENSLRLLSEEALDYPNQDALNILFRGSNILAERYNTFVDKAFVLERNVDACIYHYVHNSLSFDMNNPFNRLFFSYFTQTAWCDANFIGILAVQPVKATRDEMLKVANAFAGRKRIVISSWEGEEYLRDLLKLKEHEKYIVEDKLGEINLNINYYNDFLLPFMSREKYKSIKSQLEDMGLKEYQNFAWGNYLLGDLPTEDKEVQDIDIFTM